MNAKLTALLTSLMLLPGSGAFCQTLNLPPRPLGAPSGSQMVNILAAMPLAERENWIYAQVLSGNVPDFLRVLVPITVSATVSGTFHTATYYAAPDYLAMGTDADYFLEPTTPLLAQRLCNRLGCTLPTRKMVNQIWTNAAVKMVPQPIPASADMITVPVFAQENSMVWTQRSTFTNAFPLGALVSGNKKDVVLSTLIYSNLHSGVPKPVVIYGWHYQSGAPIQPLYNGHEETYADYSHGIRFIQNAITVDGSPNTVTNVLADPNLAALLSDEGPSQGTLASGVIPLPRYTLAALTPALIEQPRSQTVVPGTSVAFRALAVGDQPLTYLWQCNGSPIASATSSSLLLSNVQPANAGSYSVTVTNLAGSTISRPVLLHVNTNVHPVLFADSFDVDTSANWNLFWGAANGVADYTADWAFDHGAVPYTFNDVTSLIPPAPNSPDGSTQGVRFTVNNNDAGAFTAAVNIYPKGQSFAGDFALKFDLWLNHPGGAGGIGSAGSTQFAIFGLNHLGTQVNWAAPSASSSDGLWFGADGEGGTSADFRAYLGNLGGTPTDLTLAGASGMAASNNVAATYQNLFPSSRFETTGAPGKNWVEAELRQTNNRVLWILDGQVIALRTNSSTFTSGAIMLGFMDPFSSIANPAEDAFVLFDNVRVENLALPALLPPTIFSQPVSQTVGAGSNVTFTASASGSSPLSFQWRFNGTELSGATGTSLFLTNVQPAAAGSYDALVSNAAGLATSAPATLAIIVSPPRFLSTSRLPDGQVQLAFSGASGQSYILEVSTDLLSWHPLSVLAVSNGPVPFTDPDAPSYSRRFYRAREAASQSLTDFEAFAPGMMALFQKPGYSASTLSFLTTTPNAAYATNLFPAGHASTRVLYTSWGFKTGALNPWLRLTSNGATNLPNPTLSTNQVLSFDFYTDNDLYVDVGFRETSTTAPIGGDGGTSGAIEWVGGITDNTISPPKGHRVSAGQWTTLQFFLPLEPVRGFTGNGVLQTTTGKGVFEHLALLPASAPATAYNVYLDNFQLTDLAP